MMEASSLLQLQSRSMERWFVGLPAPRCRGSRAGSTSPAAQPPPRRVSLMRHTAKTVTDRGGHFTQATSDRKATAEQCPVGNARRNATTTGVRESGGAVTSWGDRRSETSCWRHQVALESVASIARPYEHSSCRIAPAGSNSAGFSGLGIITTIRANWRDNSGGTAQA